MFKYFEYHDDEKNSHKFWEIEVNDKFCITRYGRIGNLPQESKKKFESDLQAKKEAEKLIKQKISKGYIETA